ncbi:MAG: hypothetical protein JXJ17_17240 [Anaerolineae bacterium]|nr:hypothetical protein [Anaerolineae bacterium]
MSDGSGTPGQITDDQINELAALLHEFINAETFYGKQRLVEGNAILLSHLADSALAGLLLEFQDNPVWSQSLLMHRALLQRCNVAGIREAFKEFRDLMGETPSAVDYESVQVQALVDSIGEFITAEGWDDARNWLEDHPELLRPDADRVFDRLIATYKSRGQSNIVRELIVHRDLLRTCREIGIEAAFERMANPPETLDMIAENTIAVLTDRPDERDNWLETVRLSRVRAAELNDLPMRDLLRAVSSLLIDVPPDEIAADLEGDHAACWDRIIAGIR